MSRTDLERQLVSLQNTLEKTHQQLASNPALTTEVIEAVLNPLRQQITLLEAQLQAFQSGQTESPAAGDALEELQGTIELGDSPEALRRAYLQRLTAQTRRLPLSGVDPKTANHERSGELLLSAVYTALFTQRLELEEEGQGMPPEDGERRVRHLSALELLNHEPRLVLLGDPGGGKSTFVNFVALCLAGEALGYQDANLDVLTDPLAGADPRPQPWDHGPLLPVRIVLRDLAARGLPAPGEPVGGDALWSFIAAELGESLQAYAPYLKQELLERGGLILLDGLDEVPDAHQRRAQVKQVVSGFASEFPRCRFLVTSRTYAYQRQDWKLDAFTEVVLSPFNTAQITYFIDKWYAHVGAMRGLATEDAQGRATLLISAIEQSERLAELASRPLLLTLMASLHAWRGGSLPERREELYADAVDLLLEQWESPKVVRDAYGQPLVRQPSLATWLKVDRAVVRAELNRLAFEAHRDQPQLEGTADIRQKRMVDALMDVARNPEVDPVRLVEYIRDRAGLLAARAEGVYAFPHRTFQEYLAACHLTDHGFPHELARLLREDPQRWREAVLLAGAKASRGTSSAAWSLAEALCSQDPPTDDQDCPEADCLGALLAAQVLMENEGALLKQVSARNEPIVERIRLWLLTIATRGWLPPVDRVLVGRALAVLGDDRDFEELVTVPAGPFLMGSRDGDEMAKETEKPQHKVTLPAFKISKYLVTNSEFATFVQAGGYTEQDYWTPVGWKWKEHKGWCGPEDYGPPLNLANHPVVGVSWYEALAFCRWLTDSWRARGKIAGNEIVRLPTEAEWEKAARGPEGFLWPWGNEWDETRCNNGELGLGDTCAVGLFPTGASPFGCLDMAGQVWEWTISLDSDYPYDATDGRENLDAEGNVFRVLRGGSFYIIRYLARCAHRLRNSPGNRNDLLGFRVVVSPIAFRAAI